MPTKHVWRIVKRAAEEVGCVGLTIVSERKHLVVELRTPNGELRKASFSGSPSDMNFEHKVQRQIRKLVEDKT